jgi:hypothetical protein
MTGNNESYLLLCFGRSYVNDAKDLVDTLKHFNDTRAVNIVVHSEDYDYAYSLGLFSNIITFNIHNHPLYTKCHTKFEKFCLLPRLELYNFLSTDHTIVLDTDILCSYYTDDAWDYLINKNQDLIMLGSKNNPDWHWGYWGSICSRIDIKPQETHGGLFFLKKTPKLQHIFKDVEYAFVNYDKLGMLRMYQGGAVDEPCFSYAFSKNNLVPINFSEFPIMTFNLKAPDDIPTKNMTEVQQKTIMNNYIPFIHMFEKNNSLNFKNLKEKILKYES